MKYLLLREGENGMYQLLNSADNLRQIVSSFYKLQGKEEAEQNIIGNLKIVKEVEFDVQEVQA